MSWGCVGIPCNRRSPMQMCVCVCVSINRCQRCPWQAIVAAAAVRGAGATLAGATFFCCVAVYSGYVLGFFHPCSSCGEYMLKWHWVT